MPMNLLNARNLLDEFQFSRLFVEELGWSNPTTTTTQPFETDDQNFSRTQIAELSGVIVFEVTSEAGSIPDAKLRKKIHQETVKHFHEHLLIFVDADRSQSLWYWVKRDDGKLFPRTHHYFRGQPGDLFLSKISEMVFDLSEFDSAGNVSIVEVTQRLHNALDIERVTKKFFGEFREQHLEFVELIDGIDDDHDRRWYASVLLNRLMFIYFLQKKFFLDNRNANYLREKLADSQSKGPDQYFSNFLTVLFFEGFAKPQSERSAETNRLIGDIRYLNGGLFLPHKVEQENDAIHIPDRAFENLFDLFERYSWNLDDTPGGQADEINPDVLGYIFEKYINQKAFGAYYTRPEITDYLCQQTIYRLILDKVNAPGIPGAIEPRNFDSVPDMLLELDAHLCKHLLTNILPELTLLDPACGSGAFLVAAMKTLINIYSAIIGRIKFLKDDFLTDWLRQTEQKHKSVHYFIKREIITNNIFGVDIMDEATEIAKLRLFLALVASAKTVDELEPLPHIDFNILPGNSLIGLLRVDEEQFANTEQLGLLTGSYRFQKLISDLNGAIDTYRHTEQLLGESPDSFATLTDLRDRIQGIREDAKHVLDDMLLSAFTDLNIPYEQATWDETKNKAGRAQKRPLTTDDIDALRPFHWGFDFNEILNNNDGFDAIITNPPWEIVKPNAKEFFEGHSDLVSKKKMMIGDFKKEQKKLLQDPEIKSAWLEYLSSYPHVSKFYRSAPQFTNQIGKANGRKVGSDINLYKLFLEQCYNLLRPGGQCGIVIPSGIYTDLGAKQLRIMLFEQTEVTGLFCFENRKEIFENVHRSFKFVTLSFSKGGTTESFPAAFMRHDAEELESFPRKGAIDIDVGLVRKLSPDSLSVMEFKGPIDVQICKKALQFPLLGEDVEGKWRLSLYREFDMTNDSQLFETSPGVGRLPLYEGKMIWQFDHQYAEPRYWVDESAGRTAILGRNPDNNQPLDYQEYRLGYRDIAASTNERTMVCSIIPPSFHGNKIPTVKLHNCENDIYIKPDEQIFACAVWNSYIIDYLVRMKVSTTLNFFYVFQLPVPRLSSGDAMFAPIVERSAKLICTTPEFDDLASEVGLGSHKNGVTDPAGRARLRAELDGIIAHLYGLSEEEFVHILGTFPIVPDPVKTAAHNAYRDMEKGLIL